MDSRGGVESGLTVEGVHGHKARHDLAASRNHDLIAGFDPIEQLPEFVFCLEGSDFFHVAASNDLAYKLAVYSNTVAEGQLIIVTLKLTRRFRFPGQLAKSSGNKRLIKLSCFVSICVARCSFVDSGQAALSLFVLTNLAAPVFH
jgi:hypothetical protein